jgi:hypothetical protein
LLRQEEYLGTRSLLTGRVDNSWEISNLLRDHVSEAYSRPNDKTRSLYITIDKYTLDENDTS